MTQGPKANAFAARPKNDGHSSGYVRNEPPINCGVFGS